MNNDYVGMTMTAWKECTLVPVGTRSVERPQPTCERHEMGGWRFAETQERREWPNFTEALPVMRQR